MPMCEMFSEMEGQLFESTSIRKRDGFSVAARATAAADHGFLAGWCFFIATVRSTALLDFVLL